MGSDAFLSFAVALLSLLLFLLLAEPRFESNDDVAMMFISNGYLYGEPQPHLVFMNVAVGHVLAFLYTAIPSVAWYPVLLYVVHVLAVAALLHAVGLRTLLRQPIRLGGTGAVILGFYVAAWMNLQFTSTAFFAGMSGILLFLARPSGTKNHGQAVMAGLLLGCAYLLRSQAFFGIALAAAPLVLLSGIWRNVRRTVIFTATAAAVVVAGLGSHYLTYMHQEEWQEYFAFNEVRGDLHSTPSVAALTDHPALDDIGWSNTDLAMFRSWFFIDQSTYTTDKLSHLRETVTGARNDLPGAVRQTLRFQRKRAILALGIVLLFSALLPVARKKLLVHSTWIICVLVGLALLIRLPFRVSLPLWAFVALPWLLPPVPPEVPKPRSRLSLATTVAGGLLALWALVGLSTGYAASSQRNSVIDERLVRTLAELDATDEDGVFVTWGGALPLGHLSPMRRELPRLQLIPLGWQARSPLHENHMDELNIDDLYTAIAERDSLHLVVSGRQVYLGDLYERYMAEHYSSNVSVVVERRFRGVAVLNADMHNSGVR